MLLELWIIDRVCSLGYKNFHEVDVISRSSFSTTDLSLCQVGVL